MIAPSMVFSASILAGRPASSVKSEIAAIDLSVGR
jgi:hypothetical protein